VISQIDSRRAQLAGAIFLYVVAMAFEGFWLAGAYFFSDGRDEAVQAAIIVWWCAFAAVIFLWRLPGITIVASAASVIARMIWVWPRYLQMRTAEALLFHGLPDLVLIAASCFALRLRLRISNTAN
jgi:hypothetical protein